MEAAQQQRKFVVYCVLPPEEREAVEAARRRLGARGWGTVLAEAWRFYKGHVLGASTSKEGNHEET